ncbi:General transcription factor IIE subunit 2 [Hondaea fermentalgiana]|uniref:General transcription factor IIE subunit 2 n=1 Tax=Hondaea fermentalgiana TaxID=2315210 RepID=A0A2R5GU37_9STRA|nr:General transcription factor IIE subunit 2 [Hondaea fermentalgiana]|eukprot:GBG31404.1 General transcription factor IIE subunit 2 [Hondaea fermentalgiana]
MSAQLLGAAYAGGEGGGEQGEDARKRKRVDEDEGDKEEGDEDEGEDEDGDTGSEDEDGEDEDDEEGKKAALMSTRLFTVRSHLQSVANHDYVFFSDILQDLDINLEGDADLLERLEKSDMIVVDMNEKRIKFEPRFDVRDIPTLLQALKKFPDGISVQEIEASGPEGVISYVQRAITWGLVIAIRNRNAAGGTSPYVLFPRGDSFFVPLSGAVTAEPGRSALGSTCDLQGEVHRGDALVLGRDAVEAFEDNDLSVVEQRCLRVSTEPYGARQPHAEREYAAAVEILQRNQVPYSRSSAEPPRPPKEGDYKLVFTDSKVPVIPSVKAASALRGVQALKHGCTNDVKALWREVCKKHRYRAAAAPIVDHLLTENNLTTAERLAQSSVTRKRKVRLSAKPRRQNNRARKITNTHVD